MSTLGTKGFVKFYKDRLIIVINGDVIYKGENYDKYKGTGKARSIKVSNDENGEMRAMIDEVLRNEGLI